MIILQYHNLLRICSIKWDIKKENQLAKIQKQQYINLLNFLKEKKDKD